MEVRFMVVAGLMRKWRSSGVRGREALDPSTALKLAQASER
jgi:hypothetical protein